MNSSIAIGVNAANILPLSLLKQKSAWRLKKG